MWDKYIQLDLVTYYTQLLINNKHTTLNYLYNHIF